MVLISAIATLLMLVVGLPTATAAPDKCPHRFGSGQKLEEAGGAVVQQWTVSDLRTSADPAPGYPLAGRLWEATASVEALTGTVTPIIPNVYAVSKSGDRYQVLWQLAGPTALPGATINQGQTSTGKLYFDVNGADPLAVIYAGIPKPAMMWCCDGEMMSMSMPMSMADCPCCGVAQPCTCCAGMM
jgi:Domain of unknown function (DUF1942)